MRKMLPPSVKSPVKAKVTNRILPRYSLPTALTGLFGVLLTRTDRLFVGCYESTIDVRYLSGSFRNLRGICYFAVWHQFSIVAHDCKLVSQA
ncbi:MAG: hypothetical protein M5U34_33305 [Chloroflexi bacterium]|nr:hypothetical protein [Chloroflexota bacterium]